MRGEARRGGLGHGAGACKTRRSGIRVLSQGRSGIRVLSHGRSGIRVLSHGRSGIRVLSHGRSGIRVLSHCLATSTSKQKSKKAAVRSLAPGQAAA